MMDNIIAHITEAKIKLMMLSGHMNFEDGARMQKQFRKLMVMIEDAEEYAFGIEMPQ